MEEGEICCDYDCVVDSTHLLLDDKLETLLGHFRMYFKEEGVGGGVGGALLKNSAPLFGSYGSFLPVTFHNKRKRPESAAAPIPSSTASAFSSSSSSPTLVVDHTPTSVLPGRNRADDFVVSKKEPADHKIARNVKADDDDQKSSSKRLFYDKTNQLDLLVSGKGNSPLCRRAQKENRGGGNSSLIHASHALNNAPKQIKNQNGNQQPIRSTRQLAPPTPTHLVTQSDATNAVILEAKDLKHVADRLKNSPSIAESTDLYFRAALKFLQATSLLESEYSGIGKSDEKMLMMIHPSIIMQMYSSTAKLCEFCAHEYEKSKDMDAAASLAYKCMEVAYMRVMYYSSHTSASRDWHQLQTALQIVSTPAELSPSTSSVSHVDNLGVNSSRPQLVGNHVTTAARNLLNFTQVVNFAMEASRKSRVALKAAAAANPRMDREGIITCVKRALDFNFQDVDGLLRLVRLGLETIRLPY